MGMQNPTQLPPSLALSPSQVTNLIEKICMRRHSDIPLSFNRLNIAANQTSLCSNFQQGDKLWKDSGAGKLTRLLAW